MEEFQILHADSISQSHVNTLENPITSALTVHPFNPVREPGSYVASYDESFTPLDFFKLFFTEDIIKLICKNSDRYAEKNKDRSPYNYSQYPGIKTDHHIIILNTLE